LATLEKNKKAFDLSLLGKIYKLALPYRGLFFTAIIATILMSMLNPLRAHLTQIAIDDYVVKKDSVGLWQLTMLMIGLLIFQTAVQFIQGYFTAVVGQDVIKTLRVRVFNFISNYKLSKLDQTPVGTLVTRSISDLETLADVFAEGAVSILGDLLQIVFILALMFYKDWKLTLVCLTVLPFLFYAGYIFKNAVNASFNEIRTRVTQLNTFVQEHIQGMQIVQIFGQQKNEYQKFEKINDAHRTAQNRGVFAYAVFFPVVEIITALSTALIVWYGLKFNTLATHDATLGLLTGFIMLINQFFRPIRQLADRFNTLQMGMVAGDRIFKLLEEEDVVETGGTIIKDKLEGHVKFENVRFSYNEGQPVLNDISFEVLPGRTLAIVGATGAGKSSVIGLVNRFYTGYTGRIYIDDIPVEEYDIQCLRSRISVVMQDVYLFSGTILDNLTLFDTNISQAKVEEACKLAGIHEFIKGLQNGYLEHVHERGATLSTGQRQLIAFVRTMLANPDILILDEATSSIDSVAEQMIQKAIAVLMEGRTSIVIAHRLSTIRKAQEIMVMDQGRIIERGTHEDLLKQHGAYYNLYQMQFVGAEIL